MLSADHRRILRPSNNRQAQGHYVTDDQSIRIVILNLFLRNIASDVQNERLQCTTLRINLLPTN